MSTPRRSGRLAIIPAVAFDDTRLSPAARDVLALLSSYAGPDGSCWPRVGTLAARLGVNRQAVSRQLKRLAACGYIRIERRHGETTGWQVASLYTLIPDVDVPLRHRRPEQPDVALAGPEQPEVARPEQPEVAGQSNLRRTPRTYPTERLQQGTGGTGNGTVRSADAAGHDGPAATPELLPPTPGDVAVLNLARATATDGWARGPAEDVAALELLGRDAQSGGLVLRGRAGASRFQRHLAVALSAAGDPAGGAVRVLEQR